MILFLDEVHTIIGAGGAEGAMDASNILKPSLARGNCSSSAPPPLWSTANTLKGCCPWRDRFQPVAVEEPTKEECLAILRGLKERYEAHHHVAIREEALESAVALSERYISDRFLPDKAIDVLDEACAKVSLRGFRVPETIEEMESSSAVWTATGRTPSGPAIYRRRPFSTGSSRKRGRSWSSRRSGFRRKTRAGRCA